MYCTIISDIFERTLNFHLFIILNIHKRESYLVWFLQVLTLILNYLQIHCCFPEEVNSPKLVVSRFSTAGFEPYFGPINKVLLNVIMMDIQRDLCIENIHHSQQFCFLLMFCNKMYRPIMIPILKALRLWKGLFKMLLIRANISGRQ